MNHFYYLIKEALSLRLHLMLLPLFFFSSPSWAQGVKEEWVRSYETQTLGSGVMTTSVIDAEGNIYMTGYSEKGRPSNQRMVTVKYSPNGQLLWASQHQGAYNMQNYMEEARAIVIDDAGNVYVTGLVTWRESTAYEDSKMAAVVKLNAADGSQVWSVTYGRDENLYAVNGIAVDKSGGVYLTANAKPNYRLVKFEAGSGALQWQQVGGAAGGGDHISDVKVDDRGGVYVTGGMVESFQSATNPDFTISEYAILTSKYNTTDGSLNWMATYEEEGQFFRGGRRIELDDTGIYIVGENNEMIILKYDLNTGQQRWKTQYRGSTGASVGRDIALDGAGGVYVTGISEEALPNFATLKLNAMSGEIIWSSTYDDGFDQVHSLAVSQQGGVYVSGYSTTPSNLFHFTTVHYHGADGTQVWVNEHTGIKPASTPVVLTDGSGGVYLTGTVYNESGVVRRNMFVSRMNASSGGEAWSRQYGWSGAVSNQGTDLVVDDAGNTYVAGLLMSEGGDKYVYAVKYGASGEMVWNTYYPDKREAVSKNYIALDKQGGVYVVTSKGLLLKLQASNGKQVWQSRAGNADMPVTINAMALDDAGGIYLTGSEAKASIGTSTTSTFLTMKYEAATGNKLWEKRYGGKLGNDVARGLALDRNGNLYVTGYITDNYDNGKIAHTVTIGYNPANGEERWTAIHEQGYPTAIAVDDAGGVYVTGMKAFVTNFMTIKYNAADGSEAWVSSYGTEGRRDVPDAIAVDKAGGVYVAGLSQSDKGMLISTLKYNAADGTEVWAHRHEEWTSGGSVSGLKVDNKGGVYLAGNVGRSFVLARYNSDAGTLLWTKQSENLLGMGSDHVMDMALDVAEDIYLTGYSASSIGERSTFIVKYKQDVPCAPVAQETIEGPDKVRAGAEGVTYTLAGTGATSYTWSVEGPEPVTLSGQGTGQITTDWPTAAGFYEVKANYGNDCGTQTAAHKVAVYNPDNRIVAAAGWLHSPQNTQLDYMQQEGRGYFGLAVQYRNRTEEVQGQVAFQLKESDLSFKSTSLEAERLIVFEQEANFKGKGTINGRSGYGFLVAIVNHALNVTNPNDRLRLMIWEEESGRIVYDNQAGDPDEASAINRIGMGAMVLYDPKKPDLMAKAELKALGIELPGEAAVAQLKAYPNAFSDKTTISFALAAEEAYALEVYDMSGRLVRKVGEGIAEADKEYAFELEGQALSDGMYIARLQTDSGTQSVKLLLKR